MDCKNLFETRTTYILHRLEYAVLLGLCLLLLVYNLDQVNWFKFVLAFAYIDLIGYIPGAIAYRRRKDGDISRIYYVLYNSMHSFLTAYIVLATWYFLAGFEWAMLAIPIHLFGDRSVFGNFLKPFNVSFEPVCHPLYQKFLEGYSTKLR